MSDKDYKSYSVDELAKLRDWDLQELAKEQLVTLDGKGKENKEKILQEIISRWNFEKQHYGCNLDTCF